MHLYHGTRCEGLQTAVRHYGGCALKYGTPQRLWERLRKGLLWWVVTVLTHEGMTMEDINLVLKKVLNSWADSSHRTLVKS